MNNEKLGILNVQKVIIILAFGVLFWFTFHTWRQTKLNQQAICEHSFEYTGRSANFYPYPVYYDTLSFGPNSAPMKAMMLQFSFGIKEKCWKCKIEKHRPCTEKERGAFDVLGL